MESRTHTAPKSRHSPGYGQPTPSRPRAAPETQLYKQTGGQLVYRAAHEIQLYTQNGRSAYRAAHETQLYKTNGVRVSRCIALRLENQLYKHNGGQPVSCAILKPGNDATMCGLLARKSPTPPIPVRLRITSTSLAYEKNPCLLQHI